MTMSSGLYYYLYFCEHGQYIISVGILFTRTEMKLCLGPQLNESHRIIIIMYRARSNMVPTFIDLKKRIDAVGFSMAF